VGVGGGGARVIVKTDFFCGKTVCNRMMHVGQIIELLYSCVIVKGVYMFFLSKPSIIRLPCFCTAEHGKLCFLAQDI
jgi:hypothetical protein